jgi:hypothetical protein
MATLTAQSPLTGGGDMSINIAVGILDALSSAKGAVKLSVDPVDPLNPIAWGKNDTNVEVTGNKVTGFSSPTDTQYPSALLVATQLASKADKSVITPGVGTKITYSADGIIVASAFATTADIGESVDKRYVTDSQLSAIVNLAGSNSGDQDLSGYALQSSLNTTNSAVASLSGSLTNYALVSNLALTDSRVDTLYATLPSHALVTDLESTQAQVDAIKTDLLVNYTPLTAHNALDSELNALIANLSDPTFIDTTGLEKKLTFESGLTRTGDTITNDLAANSVAPHTFLGNSADSDEIPAFIRPDISDVINGVTGDGKVVLDTAPNIFGPVLHAPVNALLVDSGVSTAPSILVIEHDFAGGGAIVAGFGATIEFRGRSSTTSGRTMGAMRTVWSESTDGSRKSNIVFSPVLNGVATDALWLHADGSMALGVNSGAGAGLFHAAGGFSTAGVGQQGNVLVDNGSKFVSGKLDATYLTGQFASCKTQRITTVDQISAAEQSHFTIPISPGSTPGTTWRVTAWGNMDHGSSSVTFVCYLRWGGVSGSVLAISHNVVTPGSPETNQPWNVEFLVIITSSGVLGTARCNCKLIEFMTNNPKAYLGLVNSGATDVASINTTIPTTMEMSWTISGTSGAPHVRTFGAFAEVVSRPVPVSA